MTEAGLLDVLRMDVKGHLRPSDWYKVHDAVKKGRPDVTITYKCFTSFLEAKYVRRGEAAEAIIRESLLQMKTCAKLWKLSGGRCFHAVWLEPENRLAPLRTEVWVPEYDLSAPDHTRLYRAAVREHFGSFENGLFLERLRALHSAEYRP